MAANDKDTIYIDIDDEITGVIDKLQASNGKIVALVLPKRAAVFQSIVNMKLLKRAADAGKKNMVLITSEAGLLPLAGVAGIHVAKTLNSKPEIPLAPQAFDDVEETVEEDASLTDDEELDASQPVGVLAGTAATTAAIAAKPSDDAMETLTLDDEDLPPEAAAAPGAKDFKAPGKKKKDKKDKKLAVPNFERFRLILVIAVLVLILGGGGFAFASASLQKATITIKTDATSVNTSVPLILSTSATTLNAASGTAPAKLAQTQKTYTQQVATTGQKNNGNKASGSVTVINCSGGQVDIPAGTGYSSNGNTYIGQAAVSVPDSNYSKAGDCKKRRQSYRLCDCTKRWRFI